MYTTKIVMLFFLLLELFNSRKVIDTHLYVKSNEEEATILNELYVQVG
jgi:hypothetical protein